MEKVQTVNIDAVIKQMEIDLGLLIDESHGREVRLAWEASRFEVSLLIKKQAGMTGLAHTASEDLKKMKISKQFSFILRILRSCLFYNPFFAPRKKEFLFYCNPRRRLNKSGHYEDPYTDELITFIGRDRCVLIERHYLWKHLKPSPYYVWHDDVLLLLSHLLIKIFPHKKIQVDSLSNRISSYLYEATGIAFQPKTILRKKLASVRIMTKIFHLFFLWNKPKTIFVVCSYGKEPMVMAAQDLEIPVIELQHGVITDYHLGYAVALGLRKVSSPDYLLTFGEYWVKNTNFSLDSSKIIPIGYPYFTREIKKYLKVEKKNQIIFISQGTIGKKLSELAIKFSHEVKGFMKVVYKLHPGEYDRWKLEYKDLFEAQNQGVLSVIEGEYPSLYHLLAESKWQVGVNSTVLFEGLGFKCRTIIVELPGHEHMNQLVLENKAILIKPEIPIPYLLAPEVDQSIEQIFKTDWQKALNDLVKTLAL